MIGCALLTDKLFADLRLGSEPNPLAVEPPVPRITAWAFTVRGRAIAAVDLSQTYYETVWSCPYVSAAAARHMAPLARAFEAVIEPFSRVDAMVEPSSLPERLLLAAKFEDWGHPPAPIGGRKYRTYRRIRGGLN